MARYKGLAAGLAIGLLGLGTVALYASQQTIPMQPGDTIYPDCDTELVGTLAEVSCATPTPLPPTPTLLPTPTPPPLIEGVSLCTDHDATAWHPLVKRDDAGVIICTYGHEHHDDPNAVNDIFGAPGAWYGFPDSISYPWMTHNSAGVEENVAKHEGYKWFVRRDLPCEPAGGQRGCIVAYRAEVHARGDISDQTTRFHSFALEALVQDESGHQAIVRHGGQIDTGFLGLLVDGGNGVVCPAIAQNPATFTCADAGRLRESSSANVPTGHTAHNVYMPNWYTNHGLTSVGVKLEEWGPIDYANPTVQLFHAPSARANNSRGRVENMAVSLSPLPASMVSNGQITFEGYTDRNGSLVTGCTAPSMDCVPFKVEGATRENYWLHATAGALAEIREYDVFSPSTQKSLIRFPN